MEKSAFDVVPMRLVFYEVSPTTHKRHVAVALVGGSTARSVAAPVKPQRGPFRIRLAGKGSNDNRPTQQTTSHRREGFV